MSEPGRPSLDEDALTVGVATYAAVVLRHLAEPTAA